MGKIRLVVTGMLVAGGLAFAGPVLAQEEAAAPRAWGTVHGGLMVIADYPGEPWIDLGGGSEVVWPNGVGFSMDVSILTSIEHSDLAMLASPALIYEFPSEGKLRPYLRGGVTLYNFFIPGWFDVGGGVNYWLSERLGLKGEVRHHLLLEEPTSGLTSFRAGFVLRFK